MNPLRLSFVRFCLAAFVCGFAFISSSRGQSAPTAPSSEAPKAVSYRLSPSDVLSLSVIGEQELNSANKRIDANGNILLALITDPIHVAGLTVAEAQKAIESAYKEYRILRNPQVSINIEQYTPREVNISGMVKTPGKYPLAPETPMTLKDLVLKAGGFSDTANGKQVRVSRTGADGVPKVFIKDVDAVIRSKVTNSADGAFVLEPGDTVYVPEKII